ncbi:MAG: hypothetical protein P0116_04425 [Candidatus Nitrosocosmicus sp.]|nr:hypothetical protein [Candidatus Nitrosocosmicus sp.]
MKFKSKSEATKNYYTILFISGLVVSLLYPVDTIFAKSPYQSGYDHGCDDAKIPDSEKSERYIEQPEKGRDFHTPEFLDGYDSGFDSCKSKVDPKEIESGKVIPIITTINHKNSGTAKYCITGSFEEQCAEFDLSKSANPLTDQIGLNFEIGENFVYCYELKEKPLTQQCQTKNKISENDNYKSFIINLPALGSLEDKAKGTDSPKKSPGKDDSAKTSPPASKQKEVIKYTCTPPIPVAIAGIPGVIKYCIHAWVNPVEIQYQVWYDGMKVEEKRIKENGPNKVFTTNLGIGRVNAFIEYDSKNQKVTGYAETCLEEMTKGISMKYPLGKWELVCKKTNPITIGSW